MTTNRCWNVCYSIVLTTCRLVSTFTTAFCSQSDTHIVAKKRGTYRVGQVATLTGEWPGRQQTRSQRRSSLLDRKTSRTAPRWRQQTGVDPGRPRLTQNSDTQATKHRHTRTYLLTRTILGLAWLFLSHTSVQPPSQLPGAPRGGTRMVSMLRGYASREGLTPHGGCLPFHLRRD
jgi:hypothetical protein